MSPVETCGISWSAEIRFACVPFPDPCGPSTSTFTGGPPGDVAAPLVFAKRAGLGRRERPYRRGMDTTEDDAMRRLCGRERPGGRCQAGHLLEEAFVGAHHHLR